MAGCGDLLKKVVWLTENMPKFLLSWMTTLLGSGSVSEYTIPGEISTEVSSEGRLIVSWLHIRDIEIPLLLDKELGFQVGCCSYRNGKCNLTLEARIAKDDCLTDFTVSNAYIYYCSLFLGVSLRLTLKADKPRT